MRLKSLEIKGFKSFANDTVINFNENVIGIVGPNGSGKSNIVDAIRWVLGEQKSKDLRLEQMSNVLFNGSKKVKESGVAQVSITFDNSKQILSSEYQNITISRFLYRTGESEYRLNGVTCRLKDITTLLMDTGIGSNSYAIIALGMVEDILQDKEKARRRMFEQAAGISKFKIRKQETLSKLDSTHQDLERVQDLLFEIEGNLKSLEKQAKQTQKYFDLKDQYKIQSIDLAILQSKELKSQYQNVQNQINAEETIYREVDVKVINTEAEIEKSKFEILEKEKLVSEKQKELHFTVNLLRQMEQDKKLKEQELSFQIQTLKTKEEAVKNAVIKSTFLKNDISLLKENLILEKQYEKTFENELNELEILVKNAREQFSKTKSSIDQIQIQIQDLNKNIFELDKVKAILTNRIEGYEKELVQQKVTFDNNSKEIENWNNQHKEFNKIIETYAAEKQILSAREEERKKNIIILDEKINQSRKEISNERRNLDAKRHEFKLLKSIVDSLEGYPESIKYLKKHNKWNIQSPLLSDIIYCNDDYKSAIELYLEPFLNFFVVDHKEQALEAIQYLQNDQKGRASFFILDEIVIESNHISNDFLSAKSVLEYDSKYEKLVDLLFNNVVIVENESFIDDQNLIYISKGGKFIRQKQQIQGGSLGLFDGNKLGRKKKLDLLSSEIVELEIKEKLLDSEIKSLENQLNIVKTNSYVAEINKIDDNLKKNQIENASLTAKIENAITAQNVYFTREIEYSNLISELKIELSEKNNLILESQSSLNKIRENLDSSNDENKKISDNLAQLNSDFNTKNVKFIQQQNKVNMLLKDTSQKEKQLEELELIRQNDLAIIENFNFEIKEIDNQIEKISQNIISFLEERKLKEQNLGAVEENYFKQRAKINELEIFVKQQNRIRSDLQSLINNLKDKFNAIKYDLTSIGERLKIEFGVSINDIINQESTTSHSKESLHEMCQKLKYRIENFGEINPLAVQAYDEMKTRYDVIIEQKNDIETAKISLENTIKEIEISASSKFLESFTMIRENFTKVFRSLFSQDDNCDLILDDPNNPLESNIQIIAKPKGKRPQSINQLSGGEKTLTATALLFALYLLKPAPFCIFDEVDAPLDDANIEKFNNIIKEFSKDSQFVIVTHNKATMAAVDIIYGVYMPELGISSVTPVDFRSLENQQVSSTIY